LQGFNKSKPSVYLNNQKCGLDEFNSTKQYGGLDESSPYQNVDLMK